MKFGLYIVGEFRGIESTEFGDRLRVRTGEPTERSPQGYEQRIDFFPFDPKTGAKTLPDTLKPGHTVSCEVRSKSKGYVSDKRGLSGMTTFELVSLDNLDQELTDRVA